MAAIVAAFMRAGLRSPRRATGLIWWRLRHDPAWVLLKATAAVPAGRRVDAARRIERWAVAALRRRPASATAAVLACVAMLEAGRDAQLDALLGDRQRMARERERIVLARILTDAHRPVAAQRLLHDVTPGARALEAHGRALAEAGDLQTALDVLTAASNVGSAGATVERRRTAGLMRALTPTWRPREPRPVAVSPVAGRIMHVLNNSLPHVVAGYTLRTHRVALAQREAGLDPVLVTRAGFPVLQGVFDAQPCDTVDGLIYHRLPADGLARQGADAVIQANVDRLAPLVVKHRPAALQPTTPFDNARTALALREATGVPVVYEVRGFLEETWAARAGVGVRQSDRYRMTRDIEGWCMRQADRVVTLGAAMRDDIVARGVDPERVWVVPNAVDAATFAPRDADLALRRQLGITRGDVVLGYVSSLVAYEGIEHLIGALALLRGRGRSVRTLIVGDGANRAALHEHAERLGVADAVHCTGRVAPADVQRYYAQIDVFVVPRTDTRVTRMVTPLKPLEAMAMARPVVVSDLPALRELIEPGVTGLAFAPGDPADLARVVEPLLDDPATRTALGAAAREHVAVERSWTQVGRQYRQLFGELGAC